VVEDDEALRDALVALLKRRGYAVQAAASANDAIRVLSSEVVDLILSDYYMADGNGKDLLDHVRRRDPSVPPFIMMTGQAGVTAAELQRSGLQEFLTKPVSSRRLLEIIARYLAKSPTDPG
jgi:DNA-binding NtrC family response regulator